MFPRGWRGNMRAVPGFVLGCALVCAAQPQVAPRPKVCTIAGRVISATTGELLRKATVTLRSADAEEAGAAVTDAEGRFRFDQVVAGAYRLAAERSGYITQCYGAYRGRGPGEIIRLRPGETQADLVFRLTPQASLRGRVIDEDGEPLLDTEVKAMRRIYRGGRWQLGQAESAETDLAGEYALSGLPPGKYYVRAVHRPQMSTIPERGYLPAFYPSARDLASAALVEVAAGADLRGVDIQLQRGRFVRIQGKVVRGDTGEPVDKALLLLGDRTANSVSFVVGAGEFARTEKGEFELRGVQPGTYVVQVSLSSGDRPFMQDFPLDVGDQDMEGVVFAVGGGFNLEGSVRFEGKQAARLEDLTVTLDPLDAFYFGARSAKPGAPGSFALEKVTLGKYWLSVRGLPDSAYVKSVRYGGREVASGPLEVGPSPAGRLDIVASAAGALVEGQVLDKEGRPFPDAFVALVPASGDHVRLKTTATDREGRFRMTGIAPGDYKLLAWEEIDEGAEADPEFVRQFDQQAYSLALAENARESVQLRVIPPPKPR